MITRLRHALFLSLAYLGAHRARAAVLVGGLTVALFLPTFTWLASARVDARLLARATASPILIGHPGNEFDLTMAALYFRGGVRDPIPAGTVDELLARRGGEVIPLYVRHTAGGAPVVGTDPSYLAARGLQLAAGRSFALLGEVIAGAEVARGADLKVGDRIRSDQINLYNIAGAYPLLLEVVGVLAPTGGPDDGAFFTDLVTTWALDGALHGHSQVSREDAISAQDDNLEASAGVFMFDDFSPERRSTFHMHGERAEQPITAALFLPKDQRAHDELLGDMALSESLQAVRPVEVVGTVLGVVLAVRDALSVYFGLVAASTAAFFGLALSLSLRLRRDELSLMVRLGSSRGTVALMVGAEIALVVAVAAALSAALTAGGLALMSRWM